MAVDTMAAEADLSLEDLQPIQQSLVKYVLAWQESEEDGIAEAEVIVVMTRAEGFLLALPLDFVAEDTLALGAIFDERPLGMSKVVTVPAVMQEAGRISPLGVQMSVVLVDCASSLVGSLRPHVAPEEAIARFLEDDPDAFPDPARVTEEALRWMGEATDFPAAALYTPEVTAESEVELVPENPSIMRPKAKVRAAGATPTAKPKAKKPTTANLAASMETMSSAIQELIARQHAIEEQLRAPPNPTTAALQRPLSEQVAPRQVKIADVARELQTPPRTAPASRMADLAMTSMAQPLELMELEKDKPPAGEGSIAQAMMAQSAALTTLVTHLASSQGDPMSELTASSSTSTKGAAGRARLQAELASQKGLFFESVMKAMSRRMFPTMPSSMTYKEMMAQGVCGTRYMERFGGYGKQRDLGIIQYQVMSTMDFLQMENLEAARDSLALLAVMLEQATLDGGSLELGLLLTLTDDPPSAIFTNRTSQTSRAKAFSPLADQRWVTTALAYIRELDTITTKRLELTSARGSTLPSGGGDTTQPGGGVPQPKQKGKGKGKNQKKTVQEEETQ